MRSSDAALQRIAAIEEVGKEADGCEKGQGSPTGADSLFRGQQCRIDGSTG